MDKTLNKTKLSIFDFDDTLVNTPLPDYGEIKYKEVTGKEWPHQGWWSKKESLDTDIFDMPLNKDVHSDYLKEKSNPETVVVMLTGRMFKLADYVKKILDENGLQFDEYRYNMGGSTDKSKMKTMEQLLEKYPNVVEIEQWDDRLEHIPTFEDWGKKQCLSGRLKDYSINVVVSDNK